MGYLKNDCNTIFLQLPSKMIFKKEILVSFYKEILGSLYFSKTVESL